MNKTINKIRLHGQEARRVSWRPTRKKQLLSVANSCSIQRVNAGGNPPARKYKVRKNRGASRAGEGKHFHFLQGEHLGDLPRLKPARSPVEPPECLSVKRGHQLQNGDAEQAGSRAAGPVLKHLTHTYTHTRVP